MVSPRTCASESWLCSGVVSARPLVAARRGAAAPSAEVLAFLKERPLTKHICITGRGARAELVEIADLVTEFGEVKHPFNAGFNAQKGVEY